MPINNPYAPIDQAWQVPTLLNNWANLGAPYNPAGYWKDAFNVVHLRGTLAGGLSATNLFLLPVGYRPPNQEAIATAAFQTGVGYLVGRVDVLVNGFVYCQQGALMGVNAAFFLDSLAFRAT